MPRKEYLGSGPVAELHALLDAQQRRQRHTERAAWLAEQSRLDCADLALEQAHARMELLVRAILVLGGFHCHHGEWRCKRGQKIAEECHDQGPS
jgi:hypothetical protein